MPTDRCEAAEHSAARGRLVEMKRLRIEFRGESHDPIFLDPNPRGAAESLSSLEIFHIASGHSSTSLTIRRFVTAVDGQVCAGDEARARAGQVDGRSRFIVD